MPDERPDGGPEQRTGLVQTFFPPVVLAVAVYFAFGWPAAVIVLIIGAGFAWWFVWYLAPWWRHRRHGDSDA